MIIMMMTLHSQQATLCPGIFSKLNYTYLSPQSHQVISHFFVRFCYIIIYYIYDHSHSAEKYKMVPDLIENYR